MGGLGHRDTKDPLRVGASPRCALLPAPPAAASARPLPPKTVLKTPPTPTPNPTPDPQRSVRKIESWPIPEHEAYSVVALHLGSGKLWLYFFPSQLLSTIKVRVIGVGALIL